MAAVICKGRARFCSLVGCDFACIYMPLATTKELEFLLQNNDNLQFAIDIYPGKISIHILATSYLKQNFIWFPNSFKVPFLDKGINPGGLNSNELWQMDVTHVPSFGRQKYIHMSVDTFSGAVFASAHAGESICFVKRHFLLAFATLGIPQNIKTDNGPAYSSKQLKAFFQDWGIEHNKWILYSPTGPSVVERTHQTLKRVLHQQRGGTETLPPVERLCKALDVINFLNCSSTEPNPPVIRHFLNSARAKLEEKPPVLIKDPETHQISGPHQLITWGRGYTCISMPTGPRWLPAKNIKPYLGPIDTNKAKSEQNTVTKGAADSRLEEEEKMASPTKDSSASCDQTTDKTSKAYRM
ncbi:hypothetical protein DUI87_33740 [Hirundo rustica rustica]|uniref:Uncharacterized protein n=1 Tax=Hirundo rustica rustica TaxID=333673 RepID=A0A3M0J5N1_HIRRU|nr:hypothetical protein DUI87_33740 [Hirundo rustica rustica]